jgi:hypothetical protein
MDQKPDQGLRVARVREIQRTRLGGVNRITVDDPGAPPYKRYALIASNSLATNLFTEDSPAVRDAAYFYEGSDWKLDGVIDLDTGDLIDDGLDKAAPGSILSA